MDHAFFRLTNWLEQPGHRRACYGVIAAGFLVLALVGLALKKRPDFFTSDGAYYYAYLPSVWQDGDLDLDNQAQCTPYLADLPSKRYRYPIGFALSLTPSYLISHQVSSAAYPATGLAWLEPNGFTLVYQVAHLLCVMGLGLASFLMLDWLLTRQLRLSGAAAALAIAAFWIGSHYAYYYFREPLMIHVTSAFWVIANVGLAAVLLDRLRGGSVPGWLIGLYVFTASMALVCRPTNAFLAFFAVPLGMGLHCQGQWRTILRASPWILAGLLPLTLQMLFWYATAGKWVHYSYGQQTFSNWQAPRLWDTLFSVKRGLFVWSPILVGSVIGLGWQIGKDRGVRQPWLGYWLASFVFLWYANSAWWAWTFGQAFGARAFLELTGLFVIGLAFLFHQLQHASAAVRWVGLTLALAGLLLNQAVMGLYILQVIPHR